MNFYLFTRSLLRMHNERGGAESPATGQPTEVRISDNKCEKPIKQVWLSRGRRVKAGPVQERRDQVEVNFGPQKAFNMCYCRFVGGSSRVLP